MSTGCGCRCAQMCEHMRWLWATARCWRALSRPAGSGRGHARAKHLRILSIVGIGVCVSSDSGTTEGAAVTSSMAKALPPVPPSAGGSMDEALSMDEAMRQLDRSLETTLPQGERCCVRRLEIFLNIKPGNKHHHHLLDWMCAGLSFLR